MSKKALGRNRLLSYSKTGSCSHCHIAKLGHAVIIKIKLGHYQIRIFGHEITIKCNITLIIRQNLVSSGNSHCLKFCDKHDENYVMRSLKIRSKHHPQDITNSLKASILNFSQENLFSRKDKTTT